MFSALLESGSYCLGLMFYEARHLHKHKHGVWRNDGGSYFQHHSYPFSLAFEISGVLHSGFIQGITYQISI